MPGELLEELLSRYGEHPTLPDIELPGKPSRPGAPTQYGTVPERYFGNPVQGRVAPYGGSYDPATEYVVTRPFADESMPEYGAHDGLDLGNGSSGDLIVAMDSGEVYQAFFDQASGGAAIVRVDHGGGWSTGYAHMSTIDVAVGQQVTKGQRLGKLDTTGWATGAHLHFDTSYQNGRVDPWQRLEQNMSTTLPGYQDRIDNRQTRTTDVANFRAAPNTDGDPIGQLAAGALIIPIARCKGSAVGSAADKTDWYANVKTEGLPGDEAYLGYLHSSVLTRTSDGRGVKLDPIESSGASPADVDAAEKAAADAVRDAGVSALNSAAKTYGA
jgi:hypothetical protein